MVSSPFSGKEARNHPLSRFEVPNVASPMVPLTMPALLNSSIFRNPNDSAVFTGSEAFDCTQAASAGEKSGLNAYSASSGYLNLPAFASAKARALSISRVAGFCDFAGREDSTSLRVSGQILSAPWTGAIFAKKTIADIATAAKIQLLNVNGLFTPPLVKYNLS